MISLRQEDIPKYLRASEFFRSLDWADDDDDEEEDADVSVPTHCFKKDQKVTCEADVVQLLETMRFWGVSAVPIPFLKFLNKQDKQMRDKLADKFHELSRFIDASTAEGGRFMLEAVRQNDVELAKSLLEAGLHFTPRCVKMAAKVGSLELIELMIVTKNTTCRIGSLKLDLVSRVIRAEKRNRESKKRLIDLAVKGGNGALIVKLDELGSILIDRGYTSLVQARNWKAVHAVLSTAASRGIVVSQREQIYAAIAVDDLATLTVLNPTAYEVYYFSHELQLAVLENSVKCVAYLLERGCVVKPPALYTCDNYEMFALLLPAAADFGIAELPPATERILEYPQRYLTQYPSCSPRIKHFMNRLMGKIPSPPSLRTEVAKEVFTMFCNLLGLATIIGVGYTVVTVSNFLQYAFHAACGRP